MDDREQSSDFGAFFYNEERGSWETVQGFGFNAPTREILEGGMAQYSTIPLERWTITRLQNGRWLATINPWDSPSVGVLSQWLRAKIEAAIDEGEPYFTFNMCTNSKVWASTIVAECSRRYKDWQITSIINADDCYYINFRRDS